MKTLGKILFLNLVFLSTLSLSIFIVPNVFSQTCGNVDECQKLIGEYQGQITKLQGQANTLSNQIAQFNVQITLTSLKIKQTEEKIALLGGRIDQLEISLDDLTKAFSSRAVETYKLARSGNTMFFLLTSSNLNEIVSRFHYLQLVQEEDGNFLQRLQTAQVTYKSQKTDQEELQAELAKQKANLNSQKAAKASLLAATKNDEVKYQRLLAQARAELEAIQSIIAGQGRETQAGEIGEGQRIASFISGASACSSGTHLHFQVVKDGSNHNPAGFLTSKQVIWDIGPDSSFSFTGSWLWPVNDPVRITQGYGMTYYASVLKYYGGAPHTGIDMLNNNGDSTVKAVRQGTLYQGAIACGGGTLRYVRVQQGDGYNTYYLHVNY